MVIFHFFMPSIRMLNSFQLTSVQIDATKSLCSKQICLPQRGVELLVGIVISFAMYAICKSLLIRSTYSIELSFAL